MSPLERLERFWRPFTIHHLTEVIMAGQVIIFLLSFSDQRLVENMQLIPQMVLEGQVWRVFTFPFIPFTFSPIWFIFGLLCFQFIGRSMEACWGSPKYNLYLLSGYLITVASSFLYPGVAAGNGFIGSSVFLAFAYHFPDVVFRIYFLIPVKVFWLAAISWVTMAFFVYHGPPEVRVAVLASVSNFFLFYTPAIVNRMRRKVRHTQAAVVQKRRENSATHCCEVCGVTDQIDPNMEFRYCSKCAGSHCYCRLHLSDHVHVTDSSASRESEI